jgi:SOS-response transcriptional repressor LexA
MPGSIETGRAHRQQILEFIAGYHKEYGMAPNLREVAAGVNLGFSTTNHHVQVLVSDGRLSHRPKVARSLRVVEMHSREPL